MANTTGKKFGGRKKGTPNKLTTSVKEAIVRAFDEVGGVSYLVKVANEDPKTFCTLLGRVIPTEVRADMTSSDGSMMPSRIEIIAYDHNSED